MARVDLTLKIGRAALSTLVAWQQPVLVVQHDPCDPVGVLGDWLTDAGADSRCARPFRRSDAASRIGPARRSGGPRRPHGRLGRPRAPWLPGVRALLRDAVAQRGAHARRSASAGSCSRAAARRPGRAESGRPGVRRAAGRQARGRRDRSAVRAAADHARRDPVALRRDHRAAAGRGPVWPAHRRASSRRSGLAGSPGASSSTSRRLRRSSAPGPTRTRAPWPSRLRPRPHPEHAPMRCTPTSPRCGDRSRRPSPQVVRDPASVRPARPCRRHTGRAGHRSRPRSAPRSPPDAGRPRPP